MVLEPARAMLGLLCKFFENRSFFNPAKGRALQRPRSKLKTLQNKKPSWAPPRCNHKGDSLLHKGIPLLHKGIPYCTKELLTLKRNSLLHKGIPYYTERFFTTQKHPLLHKGTRYYTEAFLTTQRNSLLRKEMS